MEGEVPCFNFRNLKDIIGGPPPPPTWRILGGGRGAGSTQLAKTIGPVLVEDHMNSPAFAACGGSGLEGLAKELRNRCEEVVRRRGERLPK